MEIIKTYLDNVFAAFPQTDEIQTLKRDMRANMEEKYTTLRKSGKSEHEAAYSVIADFGTIEEITAEFGLDIKNEASEADVFVSNDEAQTYLSRSKKNGMLIGFGVWLVLAGISSTLVLDHSFLMFITIATAVVIFIMSSMKMSRYESFEKAPVRLDASTREMVESERGKFTTQCTAMIAIGVALLILSAGSFTVIAFPVSLFLNIVGFSVFLFITAGTCSSSYDILLGKGDYKNKKASKQAERIISTAAVIYWPVVTAIFLLWSFVGDAWTRSWVIWPVAGVSFGAICAGVSVWFGTKE